MPIYFNEKIIGRTTSGNYSFNFKKNLCFGYIKNEYSNNDVIANNIYIEVEKRKFKAQLLLKPLKNTNFKIVGIIVLFRELILTLIKVFKVLFNKIKFSIKRNSKNRVYLIFNGDIKYILGSSTIKIAKMVYYFSEIDNKLFAMDGICISNCSEFFSSFDQIVDKSFNQKIPIKNVSKSNDEDIVEKLQKLNDLYKSGVLTKEEFHKAKKKILN